MALFPPTDLGGQTTSKFCGITNNSGAPIAITAAGTGDATAVTGEAIDRLGFRSAKINVSSLAALTAAKTLSIAVEYQDSADGSTWNTAVALMASTVVSTGAGNKTSITSFSLDLSTLARYIRINFTPDLSHTSTDTAIVCASLVLGGKDRI